MFYFDVSKVTRPLIVLLVALLVIVLTLPMNVASVFADQTVTKKDSFSFEEKYHTDKVTLKLTDGAPIVLEGNTFKPTVRRDKKAARKAEILNNRLKRIEKRSVRRLLRNGSGSNRLSKKVTNKLNGYYTVTVAPGQDIKKIVNDLRGTEGVAEANFVAKPAPAPTVNNYTNLQNYLNDSPDGIGSTFAKKFPGGNGSAVQIFDLEYSWTRMHEDLTTNKGRARPLLANGTPADPFNDQNHGTAVAGQLVATNNEFGVTGMVNGAKLRMINTYNTERGWDIVGALRVAAEHAVPGDVVMIEQQTWAPDSIGGYAPVEWEPAIYDAIKALTDGGVNVIQAAGNSGHSLDNPVFGASFPRGKAHSGSIIVGAGSNCYSVKRGRLSFSNYGKRVELQGHGECVTTTGYGYLDGWNSPRAAYTSSFDGTSAATPVVAAAVASLSSTYKTLNNGAVLSPAAIRFYLAYTGTPQDKSGYYDHGNIGPLPNLNRVIPLTDVVAPSAPVVTISLNAKNKPVLMWQKAADNARVKEYRVYKTTSQTPQVTTSSLKYTDTSAKAKTSYAYYVVAVDYNNNKSVASHTVTIVTK